MRNSLQPRIKVHNFLRNVNDFLLRFQHDHPFVTRMPPFFRYPTLRSSQLRLLRNEVW